MLTGEENSIGDASSFTNAVSPRGKVMKDASPHSSSMKAMMRPCHCLLRQPLQTVRRSRCCFLASVMGSPASLGLRGANNTRDFNLKCGKRPKRRDAAHAKLPDMPLGRIAQHRRTLVALLSPRDFLTDLGLVLGDVESNCCGILTFEQA